MRPFDYVAPSDVEETLRLLGRHGDGAVLLAGGQSLLILLRQGLVAPELVIGLKGVAELRGIAAGPAGVRIGGMTSYATVAGDARVADAAPLLARAAGAVGSVHIRNLGTVGGSLCHADPAADVPTALLALDATVETLRPGGAATRRPVDGFFLGLFETVMGDDELLVSVEVPAQPDGATYGYRRFCLRAGEYPMALAACRMSWEGGRCAGARVAVGGGGPHPMRLVELERLLDGVTPGEALDAIAAGTWLGALRPIADVRGSEAWKARVVADLVGKAVADAVAETS